MKIYNLKGLSIGKRKAVITVSLPEPIKNKYKIFNSYYVPDVNENKIVIHFKDTHGIALVKTDNFEVFLIDLSKKEFDGIDFSKDIKAVLCHENNDVLKGTPEEIFNSEMSQPFSKSILGPNTTGNGTIRGE